MRTNLFKSLLFILLLVSNSIYAQTKACPDHPKLVIQIVIEQMRYELMLRYWDKFSDKGFKRLTGLALGLYRAVELGFPEVPAAYHRPYPAGFRIQRQQRALDFLKGGFFYVEPFFTVVIEFREP